jgi:hypothetical protein
MAQCASLIAPYALGAQVTTTTHSARYSRRTRGRAHNPRDNDKPRAPNTAGLTGHLIFLD